MSLIFPSSASRSPLKALTILSASSWPACPLFCSPVLLDHVRPVAGADLCGKFTCFHFFACLSEVSGKGFKGLGVVFPRF